MEGRCPQCGAATARGAKFCAECGTHLAAEAAPLGDVRKTITVLFCDLVDSTSLAEHLDPEVLRVILDRYFRTMSDAVERHGGTVEKFIGDAVVAHFGVPVVREDDALRAVRAALDMLGALDRLNPELEQRWAVTLAVRIGVNTGEVFVDASSEQAVGDTVNVAARLQQAAGPGELLVGQTTWQLVRARAKGEPVPPLALRGKERPVPAWHVLHVAAVSDPAAVALAARGPLVGRERELALLREMFDRVVADRTCQLVTLLGGPGVGKSRLVAELVASLDESVQVLSGRCLPYGDGTAFWPLAEAIRSAVRLADGAPSPDGAGTPGTSGTPSTSGTPGTDVALDVLRALLESDPDGAQVVDALAPVLGAEVAGASSEELQWSVRRWLEALARRGPVVWVVEDLHWGKSAFISVLEDAVDWLEDVPVLLLCLARPELVEDNPSWGGGKRNALTALLRPLGREDSARLVASLAVGLSLSRVDIDRLVDTSGGTPLFLEQYVAMLAEGSARGERLGGQRLPGFARVMDVPPTIGALLTARLEQLRPAERRVLEGAAVAEQSFYPGAIAYVIGLERDVVSEALRSLTHKDLVRRVSADMPGEEAFVFSHVLVADTAYLALPKLARAGLHQRYATWLDRRADDLPGEPDELVGHHLAVAASLRREVGEVGDRTSELAAAAVERLRRVAARLAPTDRAAAALVYSRAADLVPGSLDAIDLSLRRGELLLGDNQFAAARTVLDGVRDAAEASGDRSLELRARLAWLDAAMHTGAPVPLAAMRAAVVEAIDHFERHHDEEGLAAAHAMRCAMHMLAGEWRAVTDAARAVMLHARAAGARHLIQDGRHLLYASLVYGPIPVVTGLATVRHDVETDQLRRITRGLATVTEGALLGLDGQADACRAAFAEAFEVFEETHYRFGSVNCHLLAAIAERALGNLDRSADHLVRLDQTLELAGERSYRSTSTG
ncbi:MAG: AAA family ATPase, partial [Acidimicrobiales bacterium]